MGCLRNPPAALREKIAGLETEASKVLTTAPAISPAESEAVLDLMAFRERWLALFASFEDAVGACKSDTGRDTRTAAWNIVTGTRDEPLTPQEREVISAYLDCSHGFREDLLRLCDDPVSASAFYDDTFRSHTFEAYVGFWRAENYLRGQLMYSAAMQDFGDSMQVLGALLNISRLRTRLNTQWKIDPIWVWPIIHEALKSGVVEDESWTILLDRLTTRRKQQDFVDEVIFHSEKMMASIGVWSGANGELQFSEHPIIYSREWAYVHITTPLYNHDVDRFSQAMTVLIDLVQRPYYEARPALEQFYEDFDVEPSPEDISALHLNKGKKQQEVSCGHIHKLLCRSS